ncbi:DUF6456 domain-containing protein [Candidatus Tisiphia endosymbiont of Myopa tessellatipennis]|uniref:DUF6456 domain-containing protein n=1 Tax=Candidatus Tisiphia endosymbiont of Myopa tessellatipennis TaxID=3066257 RepID=UPI00313B6599
MKHHKTERTELNKFDKRPIARFYRCWLEDEANGVAEGKRHGINHEQFRAADRLACNFQRAIMVGGRGIIQIEANKDFSKMLGLERQVQANQVHQRIFVKLGRKSQEIVEHFCLLELPLRQFELKQIPQWPKGAGSTRLREALDDLIEVYRQEGLKNSSKSVT